MPEAILSAPTGGKFYLGQVRKMAEQTAKETILRYVGVVQPGDSIQDALDEAEDAGGGVVVLGAGTHTVATTLTVATGVRMTGQALFSCALSAAGELSGPLVQLSGVNGVEIDNITLQGTSGTGISIDNSQGCYFHDIIADGVVSAVESNGSDSNLFVNVKGA